MKLLQSVLRTIKPNEAEIQVKVDRIVKKLNNELKRQKIRARAVTGGSIAKGTFIKGDHDCDIFIKFDYFYKFTDISKVLEVILRRSFRQVNVLHGSRDYFELPGELRFEIVPVLDIYDPNNAVNITDCSPLHVEWVKKHTALLDEIRLAKAFCKANNVYGAESYIGGFSGHVMDILTIHHGGFLPLLKASQKWKQGELVDPNKVYATKEQALSVLGDSKTNSPLIVIDPIQPLRNAAAALGEEKLGLFKKTAREFLKKPSKEFFEKKPFSLDPVKARLKKNTLFVITADPVEGKHDVQGAKLMKLFEYLTTSLRDAGVEVLEAGWNWSTGQKAVFYITIPPLLLSPYVVRQGPPMNEREHVKMFKERHSDVFEKRGKLYARDVRECRNPCDIIKQLLSQEQAREKANNIKLEIINPIPDEIVLKKSIVVPNKKKIQKAHVGKKGKTGKKAKKQKKHHATKSKKPSKKKQKANRSKHHASRKRHKTKKKKR